ncbi:MAG: hypothetical protein WBW84_14085 [Acidobacteriaceae bacterium]
MNHRTLPRIIPRHALVLAFLFAPVALRAANLQATCEVSHSMNDAWFTGPMLANTAASAPRGHALLEPYLYDVTTQGRFTRTGSRQPVPHQNSYGSLTYLIYALTDTVGLGFIPTAGYAIPSGAPSSAGPGLGDLTLQVQRRFTQTLPCHRIPTLSLAVQETFPTGRYDNLGARSANAFGAGALTTTPELLTQSWFWLPNHRIVRMRLNFADAFSSAVPVVGSSVYGTANGFRGTAHSASVLTIDNSWEYSATRRFVLATDIYFRNTGSTRVAGAYPATPTAPASSVALTSGWSNTWYLAPAVEYSWKPTIGLLLGVRITPSGRNTTDTLTPAIAINIIR